MSLFVMKRYWGEGSDTEAGDKQEVQTVKHGRDWELEDTSNEKRKNKKKRKNDTVHRDPEIVAYHACIRSKVSKREIEENLDISEDVNGKESKNHKRDKLRIDESQVDESTVVELKRTRERTNKDVLKSKKVKSKVKNNCKFENNDVSESQVVVDGPDKVKSDEPVSESKVKKKSGLTQERGGFMVLGRVQEKSKPKVRRTLPDWIRTPYIVSPDLLKDQQPLSSIPHLSPHLLDSLRANHIHHFFPVQLQVIPTILTDALHGLYMGRASSRPRDVCCSAPTGSGKTLSFVIPIVQLLERRVVPQVRCLVLLPVIELAVQVYKVFLTYAKPTNIKVALLSGQKSFSVEQSEIVKKTPDGHRSLVDIIVTTPGRLVDHITSTPGLNLRHLRFLIVDEADRMMSELKQDWLARLEEAVYSTNHAPSDGFSRVIPTHATPARNLKNEMPLQKLVFSATLSLNPEVLQQLDLFQPRLYTSVRHPGSAPAGPAKGTNKGSKSVEEPEIIGAVVKPAGLKEFYSVVKPDQKPLAIVHLVKNLGYRNLLCFTTSVQAARRLCLVLKNVGQVKAMEMSSNKSAQARLATLEKFANGCVDMLVCTDAMARGMDIAGVEYVVSYDVPHHQLTYLHRVGRTARAGKHGTAITLVLPHQVNHYKALVRESGDKPVKLNLDMAELNKLAPAVEQALQKTAQIVERTAHSASKSRNRTKSKPGSKKVSTKTKTKQKVKPKLKSRIKQPRKNAK